MSVSLGAQCSNNSRKIRIVWYDRTPVTFSLHRGRDFFVPQTHLSLVIDTLSISQTRESDNLDRPSLESLVERSGGGSYMSSLSLRILIYE